MYRHKPPRLPGPPAPPPARPRSRRTLHLPRWLIVLLVVSALPALVIAGGVCLLAIGQTELLARIIVGGVLLVVFGTPVLCLIAFFAGCLWLVARAGRARRPQGRGQNPRPSAADRVIVGEVMFDD